jgi:hypothetical protein
MANWQKRADETRQNALDAEKREKQQKEFEHKNAPYVPTSTEISTRAMQQLKNLNVAVTLGEINKETRFWGGLGVVSSEASPAGSSEQKLIYKLFGEHGTVTEKWKEEKKTEFGKYTVSHYAAGGGENTGGGTSYEVSKFGFHEVTISRLAGYEDRSEGTLLQVTLHHNIYSYSFERFQINLAVQGKDPSYNISQGYISDNYPLPEQEAKAFLNDALLKAIQSLDRYPTLQQLKREAEIEKKKKIERINSCLGQTYPQYYNMK